jgi:hypothetical protein
MFNDKTMKTYLLFISLCVICFSSCVIFQPLPLEPIKEPGAVQQLEKTDLSKFNGNYQIISVDSNSSKLDYAFTYKYLVNSKKPGENDYVNLSAIDDRRIKATLFVNGKVIKPKIIKGSIRNNYFQFHTNMLSVRIIFFLYAKQTNRIALSKDNDLMLDTNSGGIGFLLILPIPLSGSSMDDYNLKFKRRK